MDVVNGLWTTLVLIVTIVALLLYRHFTKLRRCGIPGPTPWPVIGNALQQLNMGFHKSAELWCKQYGKVYGTYLGFRLNVTVTDTELLKCILVKDFTNFTDRQSSGNMPPLLRDGLFFMRGRRWKRTRNILTPTFSAGKLKYMVSILNKCANVMVGNLGKHIDESVIVKDVFGQFTIDAIASTAFSLDISSQTDPDNLFVKNIKAIFSNTSRLGPVLVILNAVIPALSPLLAKLGISLMPRDSVRFYEDFGKSLIADRRNDKAVTNRVDFLKLMMNAEFDESKLEHIHNNVSMETASNGVEKHRVTRLTDTEISAQTFLFFLAGMETTASLLSFSAYILALNQDVDKKLVEEIHEHIGMDDPTYETVNKLKYMDQFINEVLRFYPPVPRLNRRTNEDIQFGTMTIPKGSSVIIPVFEIHHSEENYPQPEKFDPNRFAAENKRDCDSITFLPFGTGPRHCIGMRLALVESKIALVYLLRKLKFVKSDKTQVPLETEQFGILRPKQPIQVGLQVR